MKLIKKLAAVFFVISVVMLFGVTASAEDAAPGAVRTLKAKASETTVQLTWKKVSKATGYRIFLIDPDTGARTKVANTKKTAYTVKKLTPGVKYTYQVFAFTKSGGATYLSETGSPVVSVTPKVTTPSKPSGFKVSGYGNKSIILSWSKVSNASGYYLYQYNSSTGKYKKIATLKGTATTYTVSKLKAGTTYRFKIQSYRKVSGVTATSKKSGAAKGTAQNLKQIASVVHSRYFNTTVKTATTATVVSTGKKKALAVGTKVTAHSAGGTYVEGTLSDGTVIKVLRSALKYSSLIVTTQNVYSDSVKEAFVNSNGYTSETSYLIWVNQYTLTVNIFKGAKGSWKLVKSCPCVIGKLTSMTPSSKTKTYKLIWRDTAYGGPRLGFTGNSSWGISFHRYVDSYTQGAYSGSCVRLSAANMNYLATYCALGTTVVCY